MAPSDIIHFGEYDWRVLDVKNGRALLITEHVIELRWYHEKFVDVTWEDSELRKYLNGDFYNKFNPDEKAKISTVTNENPNNPWFKTKGGRNTADRIFLLSLEEVCTYFGNSQPKLRSKGKQT